MTRRYRPPIRLRVKFAVLINQRGLYNGEPLDPDDLQFDHCPALGLREYDELTRKYTPDANDPYYIVAKPKSVHHIKTNGTPATSAGSDKQRIAKVDRIREAREATAASGRHATHHRVAGEQKPEASGHEPATVAVVKFRSPATNSERCHRCGEYLQDGICPNCIPKSQPVRKIRSPGFAKLPKRQGVRG